VYIIDQFHLKKNTLLLSFLLKAMKHDRVQIHAGARVQSRCSPCRTSGGQSGIWLGP